MEVGVGSKVVSLCQGPSCLPPMILSHMVIISSVTFDSPLNKITRELSCPCIPREEVVPATLTCVSVMTWRFVSRKDYRPPTWLPILSCLPQSIAPPTSGPFLALSLAWAPCLPGQRPYAGSSGLLHAGCFQMMLPQTVF
mgnify:CR=1 FL=1